MAVLFREHWEPFKQAALQKGWKLVNKRATAKYLQQLEAVNPNKGKEPSWMEEGITFFAMGLRATFWPSYVERAGQTREGWDLIHLVITENDEICYHRDFNRTKSGFDRFLPLLAIAVEKLKSREKCVCKHKNCGRLLSIRYKWETGQYFWQCKNPNHPRYTLSWDTGMSNESIQILRRRRGQRARYKLKRKNENKPAPAVRRYNKRWIKNNV